MNGHRLSVNINDECAAVLRRVSGSRGITVTEAIRRAIGLLDYHERRVTLPPFRPEPDLIDHLEGNRWSLRGYRRTARRLLAEAKLSDLRAAVVGICDHSSGVVAANGKSYLLVDPDDLMRLVEEHR